MIIKHIELNNFRIYKGYNKIDLAVTDKENIIVISGKNGYGKTTFLMSLVWCLYGRQMGDVDEIYSREIESNQGYAKYIKNSLNRQAEKEGKTSFSVSITFSDITTLPDTTCNELKVTRIYNTVGQNNEELKILIDGVENGLVGEIGEEIFIRDFIMPKEIAKFFFFDAEKIVSLAEIHTAEQRKSLSKAYIEVLGIKNYQDLKEDLENYLTDLKKKTATIEEKHLLEKTEREKQKKEDYNIEKQKQIEKQKEESLALKHNIDKLQEKIIRNGSVISTQELQELKTKGENAEEKVKNIQNELKSYYEIIPLAITGKLLLQVLEQVIDEINFVKNEHDRDKIEDITQKIVDEIVNLPKPEKLQIPYEIQRYYIDNFKVLMKKYFGDNQKILDKQIEILHNYSEVEKNELSDLIKKIQTYLKNELTKINAEYNFSKNEFNEIKNKIRKAEEKSEDPLIKADKEKKDNYSKQYDNLQQEIGQLKSEIEDNQNLIVQYTKEIGKISDKLKLSEENLEKGEEVEKTIGVLNKFISDFKNEKIRSFSLRMKEQAQVLFHKKRLIEDIKIELIGEDIDINLISSGGVVVNKDSFSKGEKQMYATALLKALVDESNINFPVFIDSPMQKFDTDHSNSIVRHFYPNAAEQVIIFPLLKKEMIEEEFEILLPSISKTYLIRNTESENSFFEEIRNKGELFRIFEKNDKDAI